MEKYTPTKTLSILICYVLFSNSFIYGQDSTLFWRTSGNTTATTPPTNKLGTLGANTNLNIYAGGVQRMVVLGNNGFVGIGNNFTNPSSQLHVAGDLRIGKINPSKIDTIFGYGNKLWFSGGPNYGAPYDNDNSDPFWIARYNVSKDKSQLRINLTDGLTPNNDMLNIGKETSVGWTSFMVVKDDHNTTVGINTENPTNTLEINSILASATTSNSVAAAPDFTGNATGRSGLRFTDLNSNSIPQLNPGKGLLAIDANGDVIYVPNIKTGANNGMYDSAGIVQLGALGNDPASILKTGFTGSRVVNQNNKVLEFRNGWTGFGTNNSLSSGKPFPNRVVIAGFSRNQSGLTFDSLNSGSPVVPNGTNGVNNAKVLTLDNSGKVVLTDAKTGVDKAQYDSAITALKNSITSLQTTTTAMQQQINQLTTLVNSCCKANNGHPHNNNNCGNNKYDHWGWGGNYNNNHCNKNGNFNYRSSDFNTVNSMSVDLKDLQTVVLEQNVPNPFAEQTVINYFLPDDVEKAQMLFYNIQGKLIQAIDLTQKGKGSITVFAQDLSRGIYTYTLVADGAILKSNKMIKE
jgi:hypothetical protein